MTCDPSLNDWESDSHKAGRLPLVAVPLRDYIAIKAMAALLSNSDACAVFGKAANGERMPSLARAAYQAADAMLAARGK